MAQALAHRLHTHSSHIGINSTAHSEIHAGIELENVDGFSSRELRMPF